MTTPERLRRRQRIEGSLLIFLAICMLLQAWYFHSQDNDQKSCIAQQFHKSSVVQAARGKLVERDSAAKTEVIKEIAKAKTKEDVRNALDEYLVTQTKIDSDRKDHQIPPFPPGKCDQ